MGNAPAKGDGWVSKLQGYVNNGHDDYNNTDTIIHTKIPLLITLVTHLLRQYLHKGERQLPRDLWQSGLSVSRAVGLSVVALYSTG